MSDREQHELRDLVKTCVEETNYPAVVDADGTQIAEHQETDYSVEGRVLAIRNRYSDGYA